MTTEPAAIVSPPGGLLRAFRYVAIVVVAYALAGAVAGWLWRTWWDAPTGLVYHHGWVAGLSSVNPFVFAETPNTAGPAASALYAALALGLGLIGGVAVALTSAGRELLGLCAALAGGVLAGVVSYAVGMWHQTVDPATAAKSLADGVRLQGRLSLVEPWFLALTALASATVLMLFFLGWSGRRRGSVR